MNVELVGNDFWNDRRRNIADILDQYDPDGKTQPIYTIRQVQRIEELFESVSTHEGEQP